VEVAQHHVGGIFQRGHDFAADLLPNRHLGWVRKPPIAVVAQSQPRVNDDLALLDLHHAGEATYS
jgi:hypothetical protein